MRKTLLLVVLFISTFCIGQKRDKCDVTVSIGPNHFDSLCQKEFTSIKSDTALAVCFRNYRLFCWKKLGVYSYESMWYRYRKRREKIRITTKVKEKEKTYLRNFFLRQLYKLPDSGIVELAYIVSDMVPNGVVVCRLNSDCWHYEIGSGSPKSQIEEWL
ncbi:MAG TPA: hypothetical protein VNZ45_08065, partial [Bacteroidia bacterium]|nr:hypothetical protein [Bacteroidia bacterium]